MNQKLPSLDGWRAVSISLVLLTHSIRADGFPRCIVPILEVLGGDLGVRFFFVISGFLVTWLLVREHEKNGRINLKNFYIRRVLRIVPVCFAYLGILAFLTPYHQSPSAWIGNLTFTTNFVGSPFPTFHLWALGMEAQFYLLWAALLFFFAASEKKIMYILAIPLAVAPVVRLLFCKSWFPAQMEWLFQGYSFIYKFDSLAFGCIAAILFFNHRRLVESFYQQRASLANWGGLALIALPVPLHGLHFPGRLQAALFESMQASGFAVLLLQSILHPEKGFFRALNWRWVRHVGVLSYSIFVWQQLFCGPNLSVFGMKGAWWVSFPVWILLPLLTAHISYNLLEKPLFSLRKKIGALVNPNAFAITPGNPHNCHR